MQSKKDWGGNAPSVLVAESDPMVALAVAVAVSAVGGRVVAARTPQRASGLAARVRLAAGVVTVYGASNWGLEVADALRDRERPCLSLVLLGPAADMAAVVRRGHPHVLPAPWSFDRIERAVARVLEVSRQLDRACAHGPQARGPRRATLRHQLERAVASVGAQAQLSARERSVYRHLAMGSDYAEIGRLLRISPRTVKMHAAQLRAKTGASSRGELVRLLYRG